MGVIDKQKFIASLDSRHSIMFAHIFDMAISADKYSYAVYGDFLSENSISELIRRSSFLPVMPCLFGGFDDAERKMVAFIPQYEEPCYPISAIRITGARIKNLTHRDFLGSVLGLGIKREKCGDIIINEDECCILLHSDVASFVASSLTKVGREGVKTQEISLSEISIAPKSFAPITGTVATLRLDSIVSLFAGKGRSKACEAINAGLVFVNGICITKNDFRLSDNDIISVRGKGKATLTVGGHSKKDRIFVTINRWA